MADGRPVFNGDRCIGCGHCGAWCPENCFSLQPAPAKGGGCSSEDFRNIVSARRSIRHFRPEPPSDAELDLLLSVVPFSPTGVNAQGITVVSHMGAAVTEGLVKPLSMLMRRLRPTGIPFLAGLLSGRREYIRIISRGGDPVFRGAPLVLFFFVPGSNPTWRSDGIIAAATVMHHASTMGMGTLWNGVAEMLYPMVRRWHRSTPGRCRLAAVLCVGQPVESPVSLVPERDWRHMEVRSTGDTC